MSGSFLGINVASNALRSFQRALDTTGHNIANANTRGYSRQRVEYQTNVPLYFYSKGYHGLGQGMHITGITRIRDGYLDTSYNNSNGQFNRNDTLAQGLGRIEQVYGEPNDSGISAGIERFFNSWSGLGSAPNSDAARLEVQSSGQNLADQVRRKFQQLDGLESRNNQEINATVAQVNNLSQRIADLNQEILRAQSSGGTSADLMDQRDAAVEELSTLTDVSKRIQPDGSYSVFVGGFTVVEGSTSRDIPNTIDPATGGFTFGTANFQIKTGRLSGLLALSTSLTEQKANLDALANTLRTEINNLHRTGVDALGTTGNNFFNDVVAPPQTGAIDFDLASPVKNDARYIAAGLTGDPGDGGLAMSIGQIRDSAFAALGSQTFGDYFAREMEKVSQKTNYFQNASITEDAIRSQVESQRQAVSGVSVDDEMADLLRFQRSYQAAAKTLTIFDQVTEDLLGMVRR